MVTVLFRTFRLSVVEGVDYASSSVGNLISGRLFISVGYYGVFGISALCNVVALVYIGAFLKESVPSRSQSEQEMRGAKMEEDQDQVSCTNIITRSVLYIFEGLRIVVKPRAGLRRFFILLGLFTYMCYICIYAGTEGATRIYFGKLRSASIEDNLDVALVEIKYGWGEEEVATFMFSSRLVYWVGLWAGVPLLTRIFQLSDNVLAIIASITTTAGAYVHKY